MEGYQQGSGRGREGEKVQRISSINGRQKIDGEGKNSIGNIEAKELICMIHGHELRVGVMQVGVGVQGEGEQRGGNGTTVIA